MRGGDPGDLGVISDTWDDPNDTADDKRSGAGDEKSCDSGDNPTGVDRAAGGAGEVSVSAPLGGAGVVRTGVAPIGVGPLNTGTRAGVDRLTAPCASDPSSAGGISDNDSGKPGMSGKDSDVHSD